jgi:hypothetical protein
MAVKSWYLSVVDVSTHRTVLSRHFFTAQQMKEFIKEQNILETYQSPTYLILKENY